MVGVAVAAGERDGMRVEDGGLGRWFIYGLSTWAAWTNAI